jgi:hypothetical protein
MTQQNKGGRPVVLVPCGWCRAKMSVSELRRHLPLCPERSVENLLHRTVLDDFEITPYEWHIAGFAYRRGVLEVVEALENKFGKLVPNGKILKYGAAFVTPDEDGEGDIRSSLASGIWRAVREGNWPEKTA